MEDAIRRQLLERLRGLRGAGVDWLPLAPTVANASGSSQEGAPAAPDDDSAFDIATEAPASSGLSIEERRVALETLAAEIKTCTRCAELCSTRTQTVFADGPVGAEVCFVGEGPGADEDAQGVPFVGEAGKMLNRIIIGCGMKREEVYICNIVKCRPPGNRTPLANEASNCRPFLEKQLELLAPKFIVALGGCAATNLLGTELSIGKLRGRFHDFKGIPVVVTYHPAYLLGHRCPSEAEQKKRKGLVWDDMKMLLKKMGRPIPGG